MADFCLLTLATIICLVISVSGIPTRKEELALTKGTTRTKDSAKKYVESQHFSIDGKAESNPAFHRLRNIKWSRAAKDEGESTSNYTENLQREGDIFPQSARRLRTRRDDDDSGECLNSSSSSEEDAVPRNLQGRRGRNRGNRGRRSPRSGRWRRKSKRRKSNRCKKRNRGGSRYPTVVTLPPRPTAAMVPPRPPTAPPPRTRPLSPITTTQPPTQAPHFTTDFVESTVRFTTTKSTTSLATTPTGVPSTPFKQTPAQGRLGIDPDPN